MQTLAELKRDFRCARDIVMSGGWPDSAVDPLMVAWDLGTDRTLQKPFEISEMLSAMAQVLGEEG